MERRKSFQLLGGMALMAAGGVRAAGNDEPSQGKLMPWTRGAAPALSALTMEGRKVTLQDYVGAPLILNFWASYCGPCRLEMPTFSMLLDLYSDKKLRVLAVNHGEMPARIAQFLQAVPFTGDVLLDRSQKQLAAWGGRALPTSFIIDAKGRVRFWHIGELDWTAWDAQSKLQQVIEG
ncbi:TlpA family protein disulfide reductase [Diaphorobacter sp. HDW4A]|uniref:TlpA family protein disulfide reductase n=1 Tax=Diaphorobacter sp. HDW4A TaxID=2714924 RepID=UPI001409EB32|nr:TlpA disulfide reductase family protein [Diaphorobacter sp. HDW4A]QIL82742.1 TlpA family protein disulfide reductase [Diaphorobacter sp. HDW4A]